MPDIAPILQALDVELDDIARDVIQRHLDIAEPWNAEFHREPDGREQHQTQWHQWGILTHTRLFLRLFDTTVPERLRSWGIWDPVQRALCAPIDGLTRWDLLHISILLHDIGKFGARTRGRRGYHFADHETLSGTIIRREIDLERFGLTDRQIEYVARTAEDHFVLGLVRKRARETGNYDLQFPSSPAFRQLALEIKDDHLDDYLEIGVLFLGDSLAKADPAGGPERAVAANPINEAVARGYLTVVVESDAT